VRRSGGVTPNLGETVNVKPHAGRHHTFHAVTGRRI
jgi:hypothetical protein